MAVSGIDQAAATTAAIEKLKATPNEAEAAWTEAAKRITLAADYHRDKEIGTAYVRLNDLYRRSLQIQDAKTALATQKELNKLLDLYRATTLNITTANATQSEEARAHLLNLGLGAPDDDLAELCRLAVSRIIELDAATK